MMRHLEILHCGRFAIFRYFFFTFISLLIHEAFTGILASGLLVY